MTDILFSAFEQRFKCQKRIVYATFLTDVVRGASDAIDALTLFQNLLYSTQKGPESVGYMAFDAHGGETGCHLRAGMVLEVFAVHRQMASDNGTPLVPVWIDRNIELLQQTRERAKDICARLTKQRAVPSNLGLDNKEDTPAHMLEVLGWKEAVFDKNMGGLYRRPETSEQSPEEPALDETDPLPNSSLSQALEKLDIGEGHSGPMGLGTTSSSNASPGPSSTTTASSASTASMDEIISPVQTKWDLRDSRIMVRFVVYAYVLSKYKMFYCLKSNVGARLYPEAAAKYQYELMADYWNYDSSDFRKAKLDRIGSELRTLQTWMSDLTCAWLQACAMRYPVADPMTRLLARTVQRSSKALSAVPCYAGYLLLRHELGKHQHTYVMVDRHFCSHGIHFNIFLADLKNGPHSDVSNPFHTCTWTVRRTSISELYAAPDQTRAHPVIMGNSIHGPVIDYMARLASHYTPDPVATNVHTDDTCAENAAHVQAFIAADQDRIARAFFGAHVSYSYPLVDQQDENEYVSARIKEEIPDLQKAWTASRGEIAEIGAGHENLDIFGWQHMFVETKERLAFKFEDWIKRRDLMPLSADVGLC